MDKRCAHRHARPHVRVGNYPHGTERTGSGRKISVTLSDPAVKTCNPPLIDAYRSQKPVGAGCDRKAARDRGLYSLIPNGSRYYFVTRNTTLLLSVFLVVTSTVPVVAPDGTFVSISEFEMTLNFAAVPLKLTLVAPVRSVPRILMAAPTSPEFGSVSTNGPRPTDRLKTVPQPYEQAVLVPPAKVAP